MTEKDYWIAINHFWDIGPVRFKLLLDYFGSGEKIWQATEEDLISTNLNKNIINKFLIFKKNYDFEKKTNMFGVLTWKDKKYPKKLKNIKASPFVVYVKGEKFSLFNRKSIAVIGSRKSTDYGWKITKKLVKQLVKRKFVIVSGMARGIDSIAHWTAIKSHGFTVAVLGSGLNVIYPPENKKLFNQIDLVISEFPPDLPPKKQNFLIRNRLISGLSDAVLIIEASRRSGTLNTAKHAIDQGREVFVVSNPADSPNSAGVNWLANNGATVVRNVNDIVKMLKK